LTTEFSCSVYAAIMLPLFIVGSASSESSVTCTLLEHKSAFFATKRPAQRPLWPEDLNHWRWIWKHFCLWLPWQHQSKNLSVFSWHKNQCEKLLVSLLLIPDSASYHGLHK